MFFFSSLQRVVFTGLLYYNLVMYLWVHMLLNLIIVSGPVGNQHAGEAHCTLVLSSDTDTLEVLNDVS
jgi:hypothetical protein